MKTLSRWQLFSVYLFCFLGLLGASFYSWTMTATGLAFGEYLPAMNVVFPSEFLPYIFAALIQVAILCAYFMANFYSPEKSFFVNFVWVATFVFWLIAVCVSIVFSIFSLTFSSEGDALREYRLTQVKNEIQSVQSLDIEMSNVFNRYLLTLEGNARDSRKGLDRSGVEGCKDICKSYLQKILDVKTKYNASLSEPVLQNYKSDSEDISDAYFLLQNTHRLVAPKVQSFEKFLNDYDVGPNGIVSSFQSSSMQINEMQTLLNRRDAKDKDLVLQEVGKTLKSFFDGTANVQTILVVCLAVTPDFVSLLFTMILLLARQTNPEAVDIRNKSAKERQARKANEIRKGELERYQDLSEKVTELEEAIRQNERHAKARAVVDKWTTEGLTEISKPKRG